MYIFFQLPLKETRERKKKAQEKSGSKGKKWPRKKMRARKKKSMIRKRLKGKKNKKILTK
jgi:hypothetical protein